MNLLLCLRMWFKILFLQYGRGVAWKILPEIMEIFEDPDEEFPLETLENEELFDELDNEFEDLLDENALVELLFSEILDWDLPIWELSHHAFWDFSQPLHPQHPHNNIPTHKVAIFVYCFVSWWMLLSIVFLWYTNV